MRKRDENRTMTLRERELLVRCAVLMAGAIFFFLLAAARARAADRYGPPDRLREAYDMASHDDHEYSQLYSSFVVGDESGYFRRKASRIEDSVTIVIDESTESELASSNDLKRDTSNSFQLTDWLTPKLSGGLGTRQHGQSAGGNTPSMAWSGSRKHKSDSSIDRSQSFSSTLTGRVIDVKPNGHLYIEARKAVNVNGETQTVTVTGVVNPDHMDSSSAVRAEYIMDMQVNFTGNGPMTRMDKRGWWSKAWDFLTPF